MALVQVTRPAFSPPQAPGGGAAGASQTVVTASATTTTTPRGEVFWFSVGTVIFVVIAVAWKDLGGGGLAQPLQLAAGANIFAMIYVAAQGIERALEPLSRVILPTEPTKKEVDDKKASAATALNKEDAQEATQGAADKAAELERTRAERVIIFWAIATVVGITVAALGGVFFVDMLVEGEVVRWVDAVATGLVIGGGTKLVHDLITRVQKAKDAPASGGTA